MSQLRPSNPRQLHSSSRLAALLLSAASAATLSLACGSGAVQPGGKLVQSNLARAAASSAPADDVTRQSQDDSTFACDLYAQLATKPGNLFFSPYSISSALAMTSAGAAGSTETVIASALDFSMPAPRVHAAFNALDQALASRAQAGTSVHNGPFELNIANALWAQTGMTLEKPFLDTLAADYGAGVHLEPFAASPEPARADINAWVSDHTSGRIPELLRAGEITSDTRFVLTNAVDFNGSWAIPFVKANTQAATFHKLDGSTESVQMMQQTYEGFAVKGAGFTVAELPYSNPDLTLTLIVPDEGQFAAVEALLSGTFLAAQLAAETPSEITLGLPKFTASTQASLKDSLTALGMGEAFTASADFSGIDGAHDIQIGDVIHQANVTIDENGTQAAAATAVIGVGSSAPGNQVALAIDRPFILALRDVPTGAVLFLGRIVAP